MAEVVIVKKADGIVTLLLNRPEAFNALNMDMVESLTANAITLAADEGVRGIIISGEGKAFCAGGDLRWTLAFPHGIYAAFHELAGRFHQAILEIRRMPKPVIAAVNGIAAGAGFPLALACDFRVMAKSAAFRQAYTSSGLSIDGGGSFTLPRMVGLARAMEIMAFDRPISSEQALSWGLATKVVDDGSALEEATRMALELAACSMNSFGWSKKLLTDSFDTSFETQMERERTGIAGCAVHADGSEGLRAFSEKRKPLFNRGKS
ncbi:MAG: enoyl-CoA hydratase-related protein [Syntrophobacteraceae bacterium]|jgi:2-(1,2-epoxy-1,2-dihydrophenyl)acetyl-CoA isomerase